MWSGKAAATSTTALSCAVGRGSSAQLLSGDARTAAVTSSTVTDWNWQNEASAEIDVDDSGRDRLNTGDLVIEVAQKLFITDVVKWRYLTTTQQRIQGTPQLTQRRLFGIETCQNRSRFRRRSARWATHVAWSTTSQQPLAYGEDEPPTVERFALSDDNILIKPAATYTEFIIGGGCQLGYQ